VENSWCQQPAGHTSFISQVLQQCGLKETTLGTYVSNIHQATPSPATAPLFAASQPFQDVYHWHTRTELEPAFQSEVRRK
jgi:hypothetical protein